MTLPSLTPAEWLLSLLAAVGVGLSKSGLAGVGLFHVLVFAFIFGARESTGVVLPMLIVGDTFAVTAFRQHARWDTIRRMLPPAVLGILLGAALMTRLSESQFRPLIGGLVLCLTVMQLTRLARPSLFEHVPHHIGFAWTMGLLAGVATMLGNAAGPIMALYFLALSLPKLELVGTTAWFFLMINCIKVPLSAGLGLIRPETLCFNLLMVPLIALGLFFGRWLVVRIPQKAFDAFLLVFAGVAAVRLMT